MGKELLMRPAPATLPEPAMCATRTLALATGMTMTLGIGLARTATPAVRALAIRDRRFDPAELRVPVQTPIVLIVKNEDFTAEAFGSDTLRLRAVVAPRCDVALRLPGLAPGRYPFALEPGAGSGAGTAQGVLVVG
jgi:hypothetical protein